MGPNVIERLHLLTLSLEDALARDDWGAVGPLLDERQLLLEQITPQMVDEHALRLLADADARCQSQVRERFEAMISQLTDCHQRRRAAKMYVGMATSNPILIERES